MKTSHEWGIKPNLAKYEAPWFTEIMKWTEGHFLSVTCIIFVLSFIDYSEPRIQFSLVTTGYPVVQFQLPLPMQWFEGGD